MANAQVTDDLDVKLTLYSWEVHALSCALEASIQLIEMNPLDRFSGPEPQLKLSVFRDLHKTLSPLCEALRERLEEAKESRRNGQSVPELRAHLRTAGSEFVGESRSN